VFEEAMECPLGANRRRRVASGHALRRFRYGALILMEYRGIVQATEAFNSAVENNTATRWEDQYMRMALMFDIMSVKYAWLVQHLFLARGRLLAAKALEHEVYCVE
jgi:hypothetical protein